MHTQVTARGGHWPPAGLSTTQTHRPPSPGPREAVRKSPTAPNGRYTLGHAGGAGRPFWPARERSRWRRRRAVARPETAAAASVVAPTMRVVEPRPLIDRAASMAAPESVATAGISSSEGRDRAGKARVRALGGGTHLLGRSKEALPPPSRQWQGGRPPPDANTTISAASTVWKQPRRSGHRAVGQAHVRYSGWAETWRVGQARTFARSKSRLKASFRLAPTLPRRQTGRQGRRGVSVERPS